MAAGQKEMDDLKKWNHMRDMYSDMNYNKYDSGPGSNLAPSLHAAHLQQRCANDGAPLPVPFLLFLKVPKNMNKNGMMNMCRRHGRVSAVRYNAQKNIYFVDFVSVADMEAAYRAFENNEFGFVVVVGKHLNKKNNNEMPKTISSDAENRAEKFDHAAQASRKSGPVHELRNMRLSAKQHPRPVFESTPIVSKADYESPQQLLQSNDPQRFYLIEDDAHALEHAGVSNKASDFTYKQYSYRTGRAFVKMPPEFKEQIAKDDAEKPGVYDGTNRTYSHAQGAGRKPTSNAPCAACKRECDMMCSRCSTYFCGLECQKRMWPQHRAICGKPANVSAKLLAALSEEKSHAEVTSPANKAAVKHSTLPPDGTDVIIVTITKPNVVFIRSKTPEHELEYFKMISQIQADGPTLTKLVTPPKCGQIVVAQFESQYDRAMVLNVNDLERIRLIYMDYGNLDVKPMKQLYEAPANYLNLPRPVSPVLLKHVSSCFMTDTLRAFMYTYLETVVFKLRYNAEKDFDAERGAYHVELIDSQSHENFNLKVDKLSRPVPPNSTTNKFKEEVTI